MVRCRKAEALFHYAIIITVVALGLATMHTYLRRSIQAKVKDLTDHIICERQLASLNDPVTEKSTKNINSTHSLQKAEGAGGMSSLNTSSAYTVQMEHEVENLEKVDYGQVVPDITNPAATYVSYSNSGTAQDNASLMDGLGGNNSASGLVDNIYGSGTGTSGRGSGGGTMSHYNQEE